MKEITCLDLKDKLLKNSITLIDVREKYETDICNIEGSINIPMDSIQRQTNTFKSDIKYAVICHSGVRSSYVCNYLESLGINVFNVIGGINQWALDCDTTMNRY